MDELKEKNEAEVTGQEEEEAPVLDVPEASDPAAPEGSESGGGGGAAEPELDPEIEKIDDEKAIATAEPTEPAKVTANKKSAKLKVVLLEGKDLDLDGKVQFV